MRGCFHYGDEDCATFFRSDKFYCIILLENVAESRGCSYHYYYYYIHYIQYAKNYGWERAKPKQFNAMVKIKFGCAIVYIGCNANTFLVFRIIQLCSISLVFLYVSNACNEFQSLQINHNNNNIKCNTFVVCLLF